MKLAKKLPVKKLEKASRLLSTYCWRWGVDTVSELLEVSKQMVFEPKDITRPTLALIGEQEYELFALFIIHSFNTSKPITFIMEKSF